MRKPQRGMTFIGMLCVLAVVGVVVYGGIRLTPVYLNYLKVVRAMDGTASEVKGDNPDQGSLRTTLARHWEIDDIGIVDYKDVEITKDNGGTQLHIAYDHSVPYIGNVSLSVHFDKTVTVR